MSDASKTTGPSPSQSTTESTDTRERLLDVAEVMFATGGISATSLRSITSEAGANLASIHYHFGSKDALIQAVFARRLEPLNRERLRLLDELTAKYGDAPPPLREIVEAFIRPMILLKGVGPERRRLLLQLVSQVHSESEEIQALMFEQLREVAARYMRLLQASLAHLDHPALLWRLKCMFGAVASSMLPMSGLEPFRTIESEAADPERVISRIVPFIVGGLSAPKD